MRRNIAFGKNQAKNGEIIAAAKSSAVHQDILQMPAAYQTLVGENGVSLSGGQKQRLAIARALLTKHPILIMDDALSAVDAKTETQILKELHQLRKNKTTLIATHRLTTVVHADLILVLKHGHIVERGNHQELLQKNGWYAHMWQQQELTKKSEAD